MKKSNTGGGKAGPNAKKPRKEDKDEEDHFDDDFDVNELLDQDDAEEDYASNEAGAEAIVETMDFKNIREIPSSVGWARSPLPKHDPKLDKVVFQQIEIDHYIGELGFVAYFSHTFSQILRFPL